MKSDMSKSRLETSKCKTINPDRGISSHIWTQDNSNILKTSEQCTRGLSQLRCGTSLEHPDKCAGTEISDRRQHCFDQNFFSAYINLIFTSAGCIYFDKLQLVSSSCVNSLLSIWHHFRGQ